jgi:hypothetical protein
LFQFAHHLEHGLYTERAEDPRYAVAFEFDWAAAALAARALYIDRCFYGSWSGRHHAASMQDILIVRKMPR